jgi:hypothetical protein
MKASMHLDIGLGKRRHAVRIVGALGARQIVGFDEQRERRRG